MRRPPYIPGASAPLDPPRCLRDPGALFEHEALVAAARRTEALAARISIPIAIIGLLTIAAGCIT